MKTKTKMSLKIIDVSITLLHFVFFEMARTSANGKAMNQRLNVELFHGCFVPNSFKLLKNHMVTTSIRKIVAPFFGNNFKITLIRLLKLETLVLSVRKNQHDTAVQC